MAEDYVDPSGNTEQFQAYVQRTEPAAERRSPTGLIVGILVAVVVLGGLAWLAFS